MAVQEQTPYIEHIANGVTTSFALEFECKDKEHLIVLIDDIEPPIATWSLTGGNVVFTTAPASGTKIFLQRKTPNRRNTDYKSFNNSFNPAALNEDLDTLWLRLQEEEVAKFLLNQLINMNYEDLDQKGQDIRSELINRLTEKTDQLNNQIIQQGVSQQQIDAYAKSLMRNIASISTEKGWVSGLVAMTNGGTLDEFAQLLEKSEYIFAPSSALDHSAELQDQINYCKTHKLKCKPIGTFKISQKVVIKGDFDGERCRVETQVYGPIASVPIALEVSTGSSENPTDVLSLKDSGKIVLPDIINKLKPTIGWEGQGIGVRYVNLQNTDIKERLVRDFGIGVQHTAYSQGCGYNTVDAGYLSNNKVNRQFIVGDLTGWTNRWDLYGGRYFHESYEGRTPVEGVIHFDVVPNATGFIINDINHWGGSLEGLTQQYHMRLGGAYINFWGIRLESPASSGGIKVHLAAAGIEGQGSSCGIFYGRGVTASDGITESRIELTADPLVTERLTILSQQGTSYVSAGGVVEIKKSTSSADSFIYCGVTPTYKYGEDISANYSFGISSNSFRAKRKTDLFDRIKLDFVNSRIYLGSGTAAIEKYLANKSNGISVNCNFYPDVSDLDLGNNTYKWRSVTSAKYMFTATAGMFYGEGSPEGFVTASIGSTYQRADGQAGTCFYVKETGTGNTGWIAK